jgi:hypothetical protein
MAVVVRELDEFHAAFASFEGIFQDPRLGCPDRRIALLLPHPEERAEARSAIGQRRRLEALIGRCDGPC